MTGSSTIECVKRLGLVLLGRVEPSVTAVVEAAEGVVALANGRVGDNLRLLYESIVKEPVPEEFEHLVRGLDGPRHYVPSAKGGKSGGCGQADRR